MYKTIYDLPVWNFDMINKTGKFFYLYKDENKHNDENNDKHLELIWEDLYDEFIKKFGVSEEFKKYINLKVQEMEILYDVYIKDEKWKMPFAIIKNREAEEIFSSTSNNGSSIYAIVSKYMGFRVVPKEVTVNEFYEYLNLAKNDNSR